MKRVAIGLISAVLILGLAGTGLWFWAQGRFEAAVDQAFRQIGAERDLEISFDRREITGFPLELAMRLDGLRIEAPDGTMVVEVPELDLEADLLDFGGGPVEITPSAEIRLSLATPDATGLLAAPRDLLLETEGFEITVLPGEAGASQTVARADALVVFPAEPDPQNITGFEAEGVRIALDNPGAGPIATTTEVGRFVLFSRVPALGDTVLVEAEWVIDGLRLATQGLALDATDAELLFAGFGRLVADFEIGQSGAEIAVITANPADGGNLRLNLSRISGNFELEEGMLGLKLDLREIAAQLLPTLLEGRSVGGVSVPSLSLEVEGPVAPGEDMRPFALDLDIAQLAADETFWSVFDPQGRILRDPIRFDLGMSGSVRVLRAFSAVRPGEALPFRFGNLSIEHAELTGLGARANMIGDLEFLQPIELPQGVLDVTLARIPEALDQLVAAGVLTATERDSYIGYLSYYTRQGARQDEVVTDLDFGPQELRVNGRALPEF